MNSILIIEDQKSVSYKIKEILEKSISNCNISVAHSGLDGIKIAQCEQPDTILLNVVMPGMDGYEVCENLRANEKTKNIPIILASAFKNNTDDRIKGLKSGADIFLSKPFNSEELSAQVNAMLRIKKVEKKLKEVNKLLEANIHKLHDKEEALRLSNRVLETSHNHISVIGTDYIYKYVNRTYLRVHGLSINKIIVMHVADLLGKELFYNSIKSQLDSCFSGKDVHYESWFSFKNSGKHYMSVTYLPLHNKFGIIDSLVVISNDITKRKQAEEALKDSEFNLRQIIDLVPHFIYVKDEDGKDLIVNKAVADAYGTTVEDIIGKSDMDITPDKENAEKFIKDDLEVINSGKQKFIPEEQIIDSKGNIRFLETTKIPFNTSMTDKRALLGISVDITEHKQAEKEIKKLSTAVTQSPSVIAITDLKGNIEYVNPKFTELTGYSFEEAIGQNPRILKSGEQTDEIYKEFWETISSGKEWHGEFHNKKKNGELFWEAASISPIFDRQGKQINYLKVAEDITERKKKEQELIAAKEKAEESDRLKTAFLHNMSHEIRTPMNGILGFTELLKNPKLTGDEHQDYLKIIETSGARMLNTINDLINISMIESDQEKVNISLVNLNEQTYNLFSFFKPEVEKKGMNLFLNNSLPASECIISTDSVKLNTILSNLIKNSIKYSHKGNIEFGYTKNEENIEFFIKDTGIGIPNDRKEAIFDRFVQADIYDKRAYEGSGLGLSISKAYIEMLGGRIWVESIEGIGSQFYFTIPCRNDENKFPVIEFNNYDQNVYKLNKKLNICIAEDEICAIDLLKIILKDISKTFRIAKNGNEIIDLCRTTTDIDLILMDISMPHMNGYKATRKIREFNKDVIIIAQTANALMGDREKALNAGCDDYITKPIKKDKLLATISRFFS